MEAGPDYGPPVHPDLACALAFRALAAADPTPTLCVSGVGTSEGVVWWRDGGRVNG
jgi:hypothetical protein